MNQRRANALVREQPSKEATVLNSNNIPASAQLLRSYLHKYYQSLAEVKEHRAQDADQFGQTGCAKLLRIQRDEHLAEAAKYAVTPWCPIARRAFILCGPNHVANERFCKRYVKTVSVCRG